MVKSDPRSSSPVKGRLGGVFIPDRFSFIPYEPRLKEFARRNRKNPTITEQKIWYLLQRKQLINLKFTRQKPLDVFIVDFYCSELLLAIEIDGQSHSYQEEYDHIRSDILQERYGISVIRYTNTEVLENAEGIYENLVSYIKERKKLFM